LPCISCQILTAEMHENGSGSAPPKTLQGEITALPIDPLAREVGERRRKEGRREEGRGKGTVNLPPLKWSVMYIDRAGV